MGYWDRITNSRVQRRSLLKSGAALSIGGATLALVGCGGSSSSSPTSTPSSGATPSGGATQAASTPAGGTPKKGGTLTQGNVGAGADSSANVITANRAGHLLAAQNVYDHLLSTRVGDKAPYVMEAAAKFELPDPLTVVYTLKPGMKYQDIAPVNGRAVKASDIKAVQEYVRDTATANRSFQTQSMDTIEAPDDNTLTIHLQKPNAYLVTATQLGDSANWSIIPNEILDKLDTAQSIGSGPYVEVTNDVGVRADYKRSDTFREADKTYIDNRSFVLFGDAVGYQSAFISGQLQIYDPGAGDPTVDDVVSQLGDKIYKQTIPTLSPFTTNIGGSMDYNPLKRDIRAREGFYRAQKRQQFIDLLFDGKGTVPAGLLVDGLAPWLLDPKDTADFFKEDVQAAKQLFDAAGVTGQEYEIMYFAPNDIGAQSSQILQTQLKAAGINTTINGVPTSEGFDKATKGQWHLFTGQHPAYDSPQTIMRQQATESGSRFGHTGLEDPEVDALVEKSEAATDRQENIDLVKQLQMLCLQKYTGYYLLTSRIIEQLLYTQVKNWENDPAGTWAWLPRYEAWLEA